MEDKRNFNDEYYTGKMWSRENIILVAKYDTELFKTKLDEKIKTSTDIEKLKMEIREKGNVGDTELRKLYEITDWLVILSKDTGIEYVNCINKKDIDKSENVELYFTP